MKYDNVQSVCPYCGTGCGFTLQVLDGELIGILPSKEHPVSQGRLCIKGWSANEHITHEDRLKTPFVKKDGRLVEASWSEALERVASALGTVAPNEVATLSSAKVSNEENYVMQKFTRSVLRTNNIDHCARL